jgi:hypothetical protein
MAFQMPTWRAPGVSLNYVPTKQQIGSPQSSINLDAMLKNLQPQITSALAPTAATSPDAGFAAWKKMQDEIAMKDAAGAYRDSRWASGGRGGSFGGFSGSLGAGGFGGRFGGGPGNRGGGLY